MKWNINSLKYFRNRKLSSVYQEIHRRKDTNRSRAHISYWCMYIGARVGILSQPSGRLSDESWKVARLAHGSLDIYQNFREIVATKSTLVGNKMFLQFQILKAFYETMFASQNHPLRRKSWRHFRNIKFVFSYRRTNEIKCISNDRCEARKTTEILRI